MQLRAARWAKVTTWVTVTTYTTGPGPTRQPDPAPRSTSSSAPGFRPRPCSNPDLKTTPRTTLGHASVSTPYFFPGPRPFGRLKTRRPKSSPCPVPLAILSSAFRSSGPTPLKSHFPDLRVLRPPYLSSGPAHGALRPRLLSSSPPPPRPPRAGSSVPALRPSPERRHLVLMHFVQLHHVGVRLAQPQGGHFALRVRLQPGGRAGGVRTADLRPRPPRIRSAEPRPPRARPPAAEDFDRELLAVL